MIRVENLHRHFGGFRAVDGASLEIAKGSITGLVGPNGAGKTTLFNVVAGALAPTSGRVLMDGEDVSFARMLDAFPGNIGDMQQTIDAAQIDKSTVVGQVLDDALEDQPLFHLFKQLFAFFAVSGLENGAAGDNALIAT